MKNRTMVVFLLVSLCSLGAWGYLSNRETAWEVYELTADMQRSERLAVAAQATGKIDASTFAVADTVNTPAAPARPDSTLRFLRYLAIVCSVVAASVAWCLLLRAHPPQPASGNASG